MHRRVLKFVWFLLLCCGISQAQTVTETTLYNFPNEGVDEYYFAQLIQAQDGNFYGLMPESGIFFKISPTGEYTKLQVVSTGDGAILLTSLIQGPDGNFYAAAYNQCFVPNCGSIFKLTPTGTVTQLYQFTGGADGGAPVGGLIIGTDGNLYGATSQAGNSKCSTVYGPGCGTIYKISTSGEFSVIYTFNGETDGGAPEASLLQGSNGNFYGTTVQGGCAAPNYFACGTIFQMTPDQKVTTLYNFPASNSEFDPSFYSFSALVEGSDGNYYGTTQQGGPSGYGIVYQLTSSGSFSPLYQPPAGDPNVEYALEGLTPAADNLFFGAIEDGEVFSITSSGTYAGLYTFPLEEGSGALRSGVTPGSDGNMYGVYSFFDYAFIYRLNFDPLLSAPVQLSFSPSTVEPGTPVIASWQVFNAFSLTMQQCYGFETLNGVITPLGKQVGTYDSTKKIYSGSRTFTPTSGGIYNFGLTCGGVESGVATLYVGQATTTAVSAAPNQPSVGQSVLLSAAVTASNGTPTGSVAFYYGSRLLNTATLQAGVASFTASTNGLTPGTYNITAKYSGDTTYTASTGTDSVTLGQAPTSTSLTASPGTVTPPANVTLTATVSRSATGATGTPAGTVTFYADGSYALGTAKLNSSGIATINVTSSGYPAKTYPITAQYLGDASDLPSTSGAVNVTVK